MGEATPRHRQAADDRYWRLSRRAAGMLGLLWLAVWLLPALFARDLDFTFFGAPFAIWACSQGIPIVFLLIVWRYERRMDRLDRQYRDECRDDRDA